MVKDHSDSERGNPLPPHGPLFSIISKSYFICTQDNTYHGLCYTSRGALAGTRNRSMDPRRKDIVHVNHSPALMCVSSSSSGSFKSITQMRVHDTAVLTTRCNTRTSTTWQVVGASCRLKSYANISYRWTRTPNMLCNVFCRHSSIKHANRPFT